MRVLLTGAAGFLGSYLLQVILSETTWHVICVDSLRHNGVTPNLGDVLITVGDAARRRVEFITHDLQAPFSTSQQGRIGDIDFIINAASLSQVDRSIAEPFNFIENNVKLALTVLELARVACTQRFIQISTDEVYGTGTPLSFFDYRASSPYAASKAAQEVIAHAYAMTYGLPLTIVNSVNMFGERQSQLAFTPRVIRDVLRGNPIEVHVNKNGELGSRHYIYVGDVARHIVELVRDYAANVPGVDRIERVQLDSFREVTNLEVVTRVSEMIGIKSDHHAVRGDEARPGWDHRYVTMPGAVRPRDYTDYEVALGRTVEWYLIHPDRLEDGR